MPKISIEQIREANRKLIQGYIPSVRSSVDKLSKKEINAMLKKAYDSLPPLIGEHHDQ